MKKNYTNRQKDIKDMQANERQARVRRLEAMIEKAQAAIDNGDDRKMHPATINQARSEINEIDRFERGQVRAAKMKNKPRKARIDKKASDYRPSSQEESFVNWQNFIKNEGNKAQANFAKIKEVLDHNLGVNGSGLAYSSSKDEELRAALSRARNKIAELVKTPIKSEKHMHWISGEIGRTVSRLADKVNKAASSAEMTAKTMSSNTLNDDLNYGAYSSTYNDNYKKIKFGDESESGFHTLFDAVSFLAIIPFFLVGLLSLGVIAINPEIKVLDLNFLVSLAQSLGTTALVFALLTGFTLLLVKDEDKFAALYSTIIFSSLSSLPILTIYFYSLEIFFKIFF